MATIKSYTDLEQSRKLAEFLPPESSDMYWSRCTITDFGDNILKVSYAVEPCNISQFRNTKEDLPCWSLAALLSVLPDHFYDETGRKKFGMDKGDYSYYVFYETQNSYIQTSADNPVDACVNMIIKLHELKKL